LWDGIYCDRDITGSFTLELRAFTRASNLLSKVPWLIAVAATMRAMSSACKHLGYAALPERCIYRGNISRRTFCVSAAVVDVVDTKADILARVKGIGCFPWREAQPERTSLLWRLLSVGNVGFALSMFNIFGLSIADPAETFEGSKQAFRSATEGIFMHHLMQIHKTQLVSSGAKPIVPEATENSKIEPPLRLQDLFAPDLATFYQYAIEQHCLKANRLCNYSLESVDAVRVRDIQWYFGAPKQTEGIQTNTLIFPGYNIFRLNEAAKDALRSAQQMESSEASRRYLEKYIDTRKILIRFSLELHCTGKLHCRLTEQTRLIKFTR
jgi:hypothetical protein